MAFKARLSGEIAGIIAAHLTQINTYVPNAAHEVHVPDDLLQIILRIDRMLTIAPEYSSFAQQAEIDSLLNEIEHFLRQMTVSFDDDFESTLIGRIWSQANDWRTRASQGGSAPVRISDVWELIKPVVPDCLEMTADGRCTAKWWKPYPVMDVEILMRTEGIRILGEPYEPSDLPGGIAVTFSLI